MSSVREQQVLEYEDGELVYLTGHIVWREPADGRPLPSDLPYEVGIKAIIYDDAVDDIVDTDGI